MEFHPDTIADVVAAINGPHNTHLRIVIGYWEMTASLVTTGAIDADAFRAAHGEIFGMFSKIQPFLPPNYVRNEGRPAFARIRDRGDGCPGYPRRLEAPARRTTRLSRENAGGHKGSQLSEYVTDQSVAGRMQNC